MKNYYFCIPEFTPILVFSMMNIMGYATTMNDLFSQFANEADSSSNNDNIISNNPTADCMSEDSISDSCNINQCTTIGSNSCNSRGGSNSIDTATVLVEKDYRKGQDPDHNFVVTFDANNPNPRNSIQIVKDLFQLLFPMAHTR